MIQKTNNTGTKRHYRRITKAEVVKFRAAEVETGNGSEAVRRVYPESIAPGARAFRIVKKSKEVGAVQFIDDQLQLIGVDAVRRLGLLVHSTDEGIATKNIHYAIDHIRGQATKKSITLHGKATIQSVLD